MQIVFKSREREDAFQMYKVKDMNKNKTKIKFPVIRCLPHPDLVGGLMFGCNDCNKFHLHGQGPGQSITLY